MDVLVSHGDSVVVRDTDFEWIHTSPLTNARRVVQAAEGLLSRTNAPQDPEASQGAA